MGGKSATDSAIDARLLVGGIQVKDFLFVLQQGHKASGPRWVSDSSAFYRDRDMLRQSFSSLLAPLTGQREQSSKDGSILDGTHSLSRKAADKREA